MFEFDRSICGLSLRTGSKIIGYCNLVWYLFSVIITVTVLAGIMNSQEYKDLTPDNRTLVKAALWVALIVNVICFLATFSLLFGVYKQLGGYLIPWLAIKIFAIIIITASSILQFIKVGGVGQLISNAISEIISLYLILVVYNYYRELTGRSLSYA